MNERDEAKISMSLQTINLKMNQKIISLMYVDNIFTEFLRYGIIYNKLYL